MRSGDVLRFHRHCKLRRELREYGKPGFFDRTLQVDGLNAKHGQRAAA
jgi:hypothetical protein